MPHINKTNTLAVGIYASKLRIIAFAIFFHHKSILCENAAEPTIELTKYEEIKRLLSDETSELEKLKKQRTKILKIVLTNSKGEKF